MKPVDFSELAFSIIEGGAADNYAVPLGEDVDLKYPGAYTDARYPLFPGDRAYFHGPYILQRYEEDLPQRIIDAQNRSFRDALMGYMPPEIVTQHQCVFFQGNFLTSAAYQKILSENLSRIPSRASQEEFRQTWGRVGGTDYPKESLSFKFDDAKRKSRTRGYFTLQELSVVEAVVKSKPEIHQTVFAFQAGFIDYLDKLKAGFSGNSNIPQEKKERAVETIDLMLKQWDTANFASEMIPAMCLAYHQRDSSMTSDVVAEDFNKGFELGMTLGLFKTHVMSASGHKGERIFNCPARVTIGAVMARDENHIQGPPSQIGAMMGMILGRIKSSAQRSGCPYGHNKIKG